VEEAVATADSNEPIGRSAQAAPRLTFRRPSLSRRHRHLRRRLPMSMTASDLPASCPAAGAAATLAAVAVPAPWRGGGRERIRGRRCSPWRRRVKPGQQRARRRAMRLGFSWRMFPDRMSHRKPASRQARFPSRAQAVSVCHRTGASARRQADGPDSNSAGRPVFPHKTFKPRSRPRAREAMSAKTVVVRHLNMSIAGSRRISRSSPPRPRAATAG
jgi:hypothetical protein